MTGEAVGLELQRRHDQLVEEMCQAAVRLAEFNEAWATENFKKLESLGHLSPEAARYIAERGEQ